jgi:hypothetical protein
MLCGREAAMRQWMRALCVVMLVTACGGRSQSQTPKKTAPDREVLEEVNGAVNEAIRAQPDCDAVRPLVVKADEKIEWARGQLELPASAATLDMQKAQLARVKQLCP